MPLKRSFVLLSVLASLVAASGAPAFKLIRQGGTDTIDAAASHGHMKWSHGAFLCMDAIGGMPPIFVTLDREGKFISSATLSIPALVHDFDRTADGSIALAGVTNSSYGEQKPFLAWITPDGKTERIVPMAPYHPSSISVAPDGSLWTLGVEILNHSLKDPALNPDAGVLRHFNRGGTLIDWYLPQSGYTSNHKSARISFAKLVATADRLGWYSSISGVGEYSEITMDNMKLTTYAGLPRDITGPYTGFEETLALSDAGDVTVSAHTADHHDIRTTYRFDRATSQWLHLAVPSLGRYRFTPSLIGTDGEDLVFQYAYSAAFFSVIPAPPVIASNAVASAAPPNLP